MFLCYPRLVEASEEEEREKKTHSLRTFRVCMHICGRGSWIVAHSEYVAKSCV